MIYSVRLAAQGAISSLTTVYTAPSTAVIVVRDVIITNQYGASASYFGFVVVSGVGLLAWTTGTLAADTAYSWQGRLVLAAGDVLQFQPNGTGSCAVLISGYSLT